MCRQLQSDWPRCVVHAELVVEGGEQTIDFLFSLFLFTDRFISGGFPPPQQHAIFENVILLGTFFFLNLNKNQRLFFHSHFLLLAS